MWKNKKVLVTGSEGMIGKELVIQLEGLGADILLADLKVPFGGATDLTNYKECIDVCEDIEYIFHLAGVKGNPKKTKERPVDFMGPMLQFDTNMILAAQEEGVKRFLYTSSIAVENPESDKYPAWAKQTAETLIEAMRIQYKDVPKEYKTNYCIVRPSNVYGRFDNFDNPDAMVVTSLINKAMKDGNLILDEKGCEQFRDFINAKDVARGMIKAMEDMPDKPVNLCSGEEVQIAVIIKLIMNNTGCSTEFRNLNLTLGPNKKVMKINWDFKPEISLEKGIKEVIEWNLKH
ncbi:MAG: NAD(P)-dependent oxidoreductase [Nanoarchaeota archaeon]|nr:NAD(P)-dependent oxidoreductase [Nanoarchaeota archaeon]